MRTRGSNNRGTSSAPKDLLVCFPSRSHHLSLMRPKAICSPNSSTPRLHNASPLLFNNHSKSTTAAEPTSPKVTCAGQIKAPYRPKSRATPRDLRRPKKPHWLDTLGIKRDLFHLFAAFQSLRFKLSCFRGGVGCTTDEDDEEESVEEEEDEESGETGDRNAFTEWFRMLEDKHAGIGEEVEETSGAPPANALLLMRCRSVPVSRRVEEETVMGYEVVKETWMVGGGPDRIFARSRSCRR